jgi:hypothetical protein
MRIACVLGAMVAAREVAPSDPPTRLVHPADTPLNDHTEHDDAAPEVPGLVAPATAPGRSKRSVVAVTRIVRRRSAR